MRPGTDSSSDVDRALPRAIRSPKRRPNANGDRSKWFPYYAGFSAEFVSDALSLLATRPNPVVLDPWLGAGTTGELSAQFGYSFRGYDVNPAMLIVARARVVAPAELSDVDNKIAGILGKARELLKTHAIPKLRDPLEQWFTTNGANVIRALVNAIYLSERETKTGPTWVQLTKVLPTTAFLYLVLFRTVRKYILAQQGSNPTWIKIPGTADRVDLVSDEFYGKFKDEAKLIVPNAEVSCWRGTSDIVIARGSSTKIALKARSVDAVVSSPPYCTRIDYVKATLPELAVIGYPEGKDIIDLRHQMMGTPTMHRKDIKISKKWGEICRTFLKNVHDHDSKASRTYYTRYFRQYFAATFSSLAEVNRVLRPGGKCVLVVQDSFYKDLHNDLPGVFSEMGINLGWKLEQRVDFGIARTFAGINPSVKSYRQTFGANEAVLVFEK